MQPIAFLTMSNLDGFLGSDEPAIGPLADRGFSVEFVPWQSRSVDWSRFAAVLIRSTWDYQEHLTDYLRTLETIDANTQLFNPLAMVEWNVQKTYLAELAKSGVPIVPTVWESAGSTRSIESFFDELGVEDIVIKPTVGASALDTFRILRSSTEPISRSTPTAAGSKFSGPPPIWELSDDVRERVATAYRNRDYMVQPFVAQILDVGEHSLFFFGGGFSHAVRKVPAAGDFRVQSEFGGRLTPLDPEPSGVTAGLEILSRLDSTPLYARVDLVPRGSEYLLMELELVEPSLYFETVPGSAETFAVAVERQLSTG